MKNCILYRALSLLFAILLVISLAACTNIPDEPEESAKESELQSEQQIAGTDKIEESETERRYDTEGRNYGGDEFHFLRYDSQTKFAWGGRIPDDIFIEASNGDVLNDAIYNRGVAIEEQLGIKLGVTQWTNGITDELMRDIQDGDHKYQAVNQLSNAVCLLFNRGLISDIGKLDLDTTYQWYDTNLAPLFTFGDKVFAFSSDLIFVDKLCAVGVFFNKEMVVNNNLGDIYEMVLNKKWTFDKMLEMGEVVKVDVGNDNFYDITDTYGISSQCDATYFFLGSAGLTSVTQDVTGNFQYTLKNEAQLTALEKISTLFHDKSMFFNRLMNSAAPMQVIEAFASGNALFLIRPLQTLFDVNQFTENYGIVPMPLFTKGQEQYYTPVNTFASTLICLPSYIKDEQMTIDVLQWMGQYSREKVNPTFYDIVLGHKLVEDENSAKMLDMMFTSRIYDMGIIWDLGAMRNTFIYAIGKNQLAPGMISSALSAVTGSMNTALTNLKEQIIKYGQETK